ncbi:hypothetical protein [Anabaena sp. UHCC 0451]|uniref:hypothetical protein n=1 Tax=Anabaena sp. UHCC 0451 TaxID=2055235 RepID=UPI002B1EA53B|nr:hypothetical protein [Anabaena sp. UHCC 0451]MEA5578516.1 hypothetical protein [Anabaena sp. UHCC 0451]
MNKLKAKLPLLIILSGVIFSLYVLSQVAFYYITFPFTFPLITAPFYAILGYKGFYIIPLISTWVIWFNFYRLCQDFKFDSLIISIGLMTLIFASPLTM